MLFEPEDRTFGRGAMEYDAQVEGVKIFSIWMGDIAPAPSLQGGPVGQARKV